MRAVLIAKGEQADAWRVRMTAELPELEFEVWPDIADPTAVDVALVWKPPHGALARLPNLKLIAAVSQGVDALFDDPELPEVPIVRLVDPDMIAQMSEYVCAQVLWWHRRFDDYAAFQAERRWQPLPGPVTGDCRIVVLGLGTIGADIAAKLAGLGFPVHGWSRSPKRVEGITCHHGTDGLRDCLGLARMLVCVLPLTPDTQQVINADTLAQLPRGAYFINVARGGHVVEADLLAALESGQLAGAALDVMVEEPLPPEHPFWMHPKVRITPHIAGVTRPETAAAQIADNIRRVMSGRPLRNVVDRLRRY